MGHFGEHFNVFTGRKFQLGLLVIFLSFVLTFSTITDSFGGLIPNVPIPSASPLTVSAKVIKVTNNDGRVQPGSILDIEYTLTNKTPDKGTLSLTTSLYPGLERTSTKTGCTYDTQSYLDKEHCYVAFSGETSKFSYSVRVNEVLPSEYTGNDYNPEIERYLKVSIEDPNSNNSFTDDLKIPLEIFSPDDIRIESMLINPDIYDNHGQILPGKQIKIVYEIKNYASTPVTVPFEIKFFEGMHLKNLGGCIQESNFQKCSWMNGIQFKPGQSMKRNAVLIIDELPGNYDRKVDLRIGFEGSSFIENYHHKVLEFRLDSAPEFPDLETKLTTRPTEFHSGQVYDIVIDIENIGEGRAERNDLHFFMSMEDTVPGASISIFNSPSSCTQNGPSSVTCNLVDLDPGQKLSQSFKIDMDSFFGELDFGIRVTTRDSTGSSNDSNNDNNSIILQNINVIPPPSTPPPSTPPPSTPPPSTPPPSTSQPSTYINAEPLKPVSSTTRPIDANALNPDSYYIETHVDSEQLSLIAQGCNVGDPPQFGGSSFQWGVGPGHHLIWALINGNVREKPLDVAIDELVEYSILGVSQDGHSLLVMEFRQPIWFTGTPTVGCKWMSEDEGNLIFAQYNTARNSEILPAHILPISKDGLPYAASYTQSLIQSVGGHHYLTDSGKMHYKIPGSNSYGSNFHIPYSDPVTGYGGSQSVYIGDTSKNHYVSLHENSGLWSESKWASTVSYASIVHKWALIGWHQIPIPNQPISSSGVAQIPTYSSDNRGTTPKQDTPDYSNTPSDFSSTTSNNPNDFDGDGIPNNLDYCENHPEDYNGFLDTDGCPDVAPDYGSTSPSTAPPSTAPPTTQPSVQIFGDFKMYPNKFSLSDTSKTVQISGEVENYERGTVISLTLTNPDGTSESKATTASRMGKYTFVLNDISWKVGQYIVKIDYNGITEGIKTITVTEPTTIPKTDPTPTYDSTADSIPAYEPPAPILPTPASDGVDVIVGFGTSVPGCEESNSCYSPHTISVKAGDTVTWYNEDTAAHTVTGGDAEDGPSGTFDSSLFMAGSDYSVVFTEPGEYPYFCMVHPWMIGTVIVSPSPAFNPQTLSNDLNSESAQTDLNSESDQTNQKEKQVYRSDRAPSQPKGLKIVSSEGTDQTGNKISSFSKGSVGFVKIVVSSDKKINSALITINLFDSDGTTLGVGSTKLPLNPGTSEVIVSFNIPQDASSDMANIYSNVFSDWPSNGGKPLTLEKEGNIRIQ